MVMEHVIIYSEAMQYMCNSIFIYSILEYSSYVELYLRLFENSPTIQ